MKNKSSKPKEYLFVDGYNVINAWEKLKALSQINLEQARNELIDIMTEYQHYSGIKVIIVFDAHYVKNNSGKKDNIKGVDIVYTKENETADQYIERTLDAIGRLKKVRVATSDWMEQQVILSRGGTRISAREVEAEIQDERRLIINKRKKNNKINDVMIGRLDEETLKKLEKWGKNTE